MLQCPTASLFPRSSLKTIDLCQEDYEHSSEQSLLEEVIQNEDSIQFMAGLWFTHLALVFLEYVGLKCITIYRLIFNFFRCVDGTSTLNIYLVS